MTADSRPETALVTGPSDPNRPEITSVLLCADILATRESEQQSNLRWFADLLSRPIGEAVPTATLRVGLASSFSRRAILETAADADDVRERHCWFDPDALGDPALTALSDSIGRNTLVVGYELSWMTRHVLSKIGVSWIDVWLHPVRFADDILFAVRASEPRVDARVSGFAVADEAFRAEADLLKVRAYRGGLGPAPDLIDGAALFAGQTARDKSVLDSRGFLNLLDFQDEFARLAETHPHVYFSRHPHQPHIQRDIRQFLARFSNVSEISVPTYDLLADARIATVASISSSVLEEARYFGKRTSRFFRPPFPLEGEDRYHAILQAPCFSHFWGTALRDVASIVETAPAGFISTRNKLRHSLSFSWGYRDLEDGGQNANLPVPNRGERQYVPTIETADLVTFDVFDTLIARRVASPRDVFALMAEDAVEVAGGAATDFVDRRVAAEGDAARQAARAGREDPSLKEIYASLMNSATDDDRVSKLCALEIETQRAVSMPRPAGAALYDRARKAGRRIVLMSDMYLPRDTICAMLADCGYDGWEDCLVSSETGRTKRNGTLFETLLESSGVDAGRILHVGDNPKGDVAVPKRFGIATCHLPLAVETMRHAAPFLRHATTEMTREGPDSGSAFVAAVANRVYDTSDPASQSDGFGGDAATLGYAVLGPLLTGFVGWLHRTAAEQKMDTLGFLTREGPLFRAAYETLHPDCRLNKRTVIASRRIVMDMSLCSEDALEQAVMRLGAGFAGSAEDFLDIHFGITGNDIDAAALKAAGLSETDDPRASSPGIKGLQKAVHAHRERIMSRSQDTRGQVAQYAREIGLTSGRTGLVDIGYAGQVQAAYSRVAETDMSGFYLATFRRARDVLDGLSSSAFLAEHARADDQRYGICRHRQIYEALLCAPGPTFVGLSKEGGSWHGIASVHGETPARDAFAREAHAGALEFVADFRDSGMSVPKSPAAATAIADAMLDDPTPRLAEWLGRLEFDDSFAADRLTTLINTRKAPASSVWSEGALALLGRSKPQPVRRQRWRLLGPYGILGWRHALSPVVAMVIARIGDAKDVDHFRDDPIAFFRRLSDPRYRRIGRILYPWD